MKYLSPLLAAALLSQPSVAQAPSAENVILSNSAWCKGMTALRLDQLPRTSGGAIKFRPNHTPGGTGPRYVLWLPQMVNLDVKLVGGGGGGGSSRAAKEAGPGEGGKTAPTLAVFQLKDVEPDYYLLKMGFGGKGATGPHSSRQPRAGEDGGTTRLSRCSSNATIAEAIGGAGGRGDVGRLVNDRAPDGEMHIDRDLPTVVSSGGRGGGWRQHGRHASGIGAGGGGQGLTNEANADHGGNGSGGYMRIDCVSPETACPIKPPV